MIGDTGISFQLRNPGEREILFNVTVFIAY
jgi:hypothetical protein